MTAEKEFNGAVSAIDTSKRILTMFDEHGVTHPFKWTEPLDVVLAKQKIGYGLTLKYDDETRVLKSAVFWSKPEGFNKGKGKSYAPRNEKPMIHESAFKTCADLVRDTDFPGQTYEQRVEAVRVQAEKIAFWMMKGSGV